MLKNELKIRITKASIELDLREILIVKFLFLISSSKKYTSQELIRQTGLPKTHLYRLISNFTDLIEPKSNFIEIKADFSQKINQYLIELNKETELDNKLIKNKIWEYQKLRPSSDRQLDQFNCTIKTTIKRVNKLAKNGDLLDKEIIFLGDDDLTSVAAALTGQPKKITVFEIDDRLVSFINKISNENNLNIEVVKTDLSQNLDENYLNKFDIIFTDPPYTKEGVNLFLNQAIKLVKKNLLGRIYLCYGNSDRAREREVEIQKLILDHNLIIKSKYNQFNKYHGAQSIGSSSSLYVLDWTPSTKIIKSELKKIYTND